MLHFQLDFKFKRLLTNLFIRHTPEKELMVSNGSFNFPYNNIHQLEFKLNNKIILLKYYLLTKIKLQN